MGNEKGSITTPFDKLFAGLSISREGWEELCAAVETMDRAFVLTWLEDNVARSIAETQRCWTTTNAMDTLLAALQANISLRYPSGGFKTIHKLKKDAGLA